LTHFTPFYDYFRTFYGDKILTHFAHLTQNGELVEPGFHPKNQRSTPKSTPKKLGKTPSPM
jgi:hypothetical protein